MSSGKTILKLNYEIFIKILDNNFCSWDYGGRVFNIISISSNISYTEKKAPSFKRGLASL